MIQFFYLILLFFPAQKALATEGSFPARCPHCDLKDPQYQLIKEQKECLQLISREECQEIPEEERKTCSKEDHLKLTDTGSILYQCAEDTLLSYKFIFDLLWYLIHNAKSWFFEDEEDSQSSPAKNYLLTEFYRAYNSSEGNRLERLLKAASLVGGQQFDLFWSSLKQFIETEFVSFKCYKPSAQLTIGCVFLVGFVVPGSGVVTVLKRGVKTGSGIIKHFKKAAQKLNQKRKFNAFIKDLETNFDSFRQTVVKSSKDLKKWEKKEITLFFDKVDKSQFLSGLKSRLNKKIDQGAKLNKRQVQAAIIGSLTAGAVVASIKLSAKSAAVISEGIVDTLVTKYVNQNVISEEEQN